MAEEKKKRWRPSLTAYRELEETIHRQCVELDAWREKYHELLKSTKESYSSLQEDYDALYAENLSLKSRGFWARVFNK